MKPTVYKPNPTAKPLAPNANIMHAVSGMSQYQMDEIKRKALSGEKLQITTEAKRALYEAFKANPNTNLKQHSAAVMANAKGLSQVTLNEIKRKALAGEKLQTTTETKRALYDAFKANPSQEASIKALMGNSAAQAFLRASYKDPNTGNSVAKPSDPKLPFDPLEQEMTDAEKDEAEYLKMLEEAWMQEQSSLQTGQYDSLGRLGTSRQAQMDGQDISLNNGMQSMDANNFQQFQQLQQQMSDRGMGESGIAADSYMRASMGANQAYQGAYAQSALAKGEIENNYANSANDVQASYTDAINSARNSYTDKTGSTKAAYTELYSKIGQGQRDYINMQEANKVANQQAAQAAQAKQDEFSTTSTGILHIGGKPVMSNGKPITTVEYQKMTETQRHNLADEQNAAVKNQMDYIIGQGNVQNGANKNSIDAQNNAWNYNINNDKNVIDAQKNVIDAQKNAWDYEIDKEGNAIDSQGNVLTYEAKMDANNAKREDTLAKLTIASGKLDLDYAKLDLKDKEVTAKIQSSIDNLAIVAKNASTKETSAKATAIGKELTSVDKQIAAYIKSGKPVPKAVKEKLEGLHNQMQALVTGEKAAMGKSSSTGLGSLSAKYESGSQGGGAVANTKGDQGGASYGKYQLTKNSGHAQAFAYKFGGSLKGKTPGTESFNKAWKAEFAKDPIGFTNAQHAYIEEKHYKPALTAAQKSTGINLSSMPKAVQDMIWSIGVQHGAGGTSSIFRNAGIKKGDSAETIIRKAYAERMKVNKYFSSSPQNIKNNVLARFKNELSDALAMLKSTSKKGGNQQT